MDQPVEELSANEVLFADVRTTPAEQESHYDGTISDRWSVWGPIGGYVVGICLNSASQSAVLPTPLSVSAHFLRSISFGPCKVITRVLRRSASREVIGATLLQEDMPRLEALFHFGSASSATSPVAEDVGPTVDKPEQISRLVRLPSAWQYIDERRLALPPDMSGEAVTRSWYRLAERSFLDGAVRVATQLLLFADLPVWPAAREGFPDGIFDEEFSGRTSYIYAQFGHLQDSSEWFLCEGRALSCSGLVMNGGVSIWNERSNPTCQAMQQMLLRKR
jgi:hypothetical protein